MSHWKWNGGRVRRRMVTVTALSVLLVLLLPGPASAFPLWGDTSVGVTSYHQVSVMQGDDPGTTVVEDRSQIGVVDRTLWYVPWNSTEIYTYLPPDARNVTFDNVRMISHQGTAIFIPGEFSEAQNPDDPPTIGPVEGAGYEGYYRWAFPEGADRSLDQELNFSSKESFDDGDPELNTMDDWNTSGGALELAPGVPSSTYVSKRYTGGIDLVSVNMTYAAQGDGNITFQVSADNGSTWQPLERGVVRAQDDFCGDFRWRATFTQNVSANDTPVLQWVSFQLTFIPEYNELIMETSYILDMDSRTFEFDTYFPFDSNSSSFILIFYLDKDMSLDVEGTSVTLTTGLYEDKDTYTHMTGGYDLVLSYTIKDLRTSDDGGGGTSTGFYIVVLVLVILMVIGVAMVMSSDRREGGPHEGEAVEGDENEVADLRSRKEELVEAISELDGDLAIGLITEEEHRARREELKADAVDVMRCLDAQDDDED